MRLSLVTSRVDDGPPPGAATKVGEEGVLHLGGARARPEGGQPAQDPGGAEAALAGTMSIEGGHKRPQNRWFEAVYRDNRTTGDPPHRRHARHAGRAIHEHGATTALALGAAPILNRAGARLPQYLEQRNVITLDLDG